MLPIHHTGSIVCIIAKSLQVVVLSATVAKLASSQTGFSLPEGSSTHDSTGHWHSLAGMGYCERKLRENLQDNGMPIERLNAPK